MRLTLPPGAYVLLMTDGFFRFVEPYGLETPASLLARVEAGDAVDAGDPIGVVIAHAHSRGFHWGLKNGRVYADPMLLLRRAVILKPLRGQARGCACS